MAVNITRFHNVFLYQSHATVPELLQDMEVLGHLDARAEEQLGAMKKGIWLTGVPGGVLIGLCWGLWASSADGATPLSGEEAQFADWALAVGLLLLGVGSFLFIWRSRLRPRDLDNRRYDLARVLLKRLHVDLAPDASVRLKLDLRQPDVQDKRVKQEMVGWWDTQFFVDPWFTLEGRLADGTFLKIHMVERLQKRERSKTSASGKTRTKTKTKGFARLDVSLRVKADRHPGLGALKAQATRALRLPRRVELERVRVAADRLSVRARLAQDWVAREGRALEKDDASRTATMMLLSLYQVLHYARRRGKWQAARRQRRSV
ncbi:hypothetical protein OV207_01960 [Corallococcus sp. BB11-1]|uniref:hypothetical protein n=1 Tax=Corallococcus sp. BB11-1 TaxID=2996783 RepID=UPI00227012EE|nr:hypothetical protein [Corallococcus sp. BB11-1]MCY1030204.1 hypothetical protein [Corallococcus sp. BB11-1]